MCRMFAYTGSSTSELHALYKALRESALNDTRAESFFALTEIFLYLVISTFID